MLTFRQLENYNYEFYLFGRLLVDYKLVPKDLEYDIAHEQSVLLYEEFLNSEMNDLECSAYDCMKDFIKFKLKEV